MAIWNGTCKVLANTGICPGHMAYFPTKAARDGANNGGTVIETLAELSFIRPDLLSKNAYAAGSVDTDLKYNAASEADYVMFNNVDIDPARWFYGRITRREYVSPSSTRLWFETDWYSTFQDVLTLGTCLVERSHIKEADDWNGNTPRYNNMLAEPVSVVTNETPYTEWNAIAKPTWDNIVPVGFIVYATSDPDGQSNIAFRVIAGSPTACHVIFCQNLDELESVIKEYMDSDFLGRDKSSIENIIAVSWVPPALMVDGMSSDTIMRIFTPKPQKTQFTRTNGLPVRYAKSMSYPYVYITAKSPVGDQLVIRPEEFTNQDLIEHVVEGCGGIDARYRYYLKVNNTPEEFAMKFLNLPVYPQLPILSDAYQRWLSQNASNIVVRGMSAAATIGLAAAAISLAPVTGGSSIVMGAAAAGVSGGIQAAGTAGSVNDAKSLPDTMVGAANGSNTAAWRLYKVGFYINRPTINDITAIDDVFHTFGYCINRHEVPNLQVKDRWTYVQTKNAQVTGKCPLEAITYTQNMLNNGTTFWNIANTPIGQYSDINPG